MARRSCCSLWSLKISHPAQPARPAGPAPHHHPPPHFPDMDLGGAPGTILASRLSAVPLSAEGWGEVGWLGGWVGRLVGRKAGGLVGW